MYVHVYVYAYVHVYVYVCMCVYISTYICALLGSPVVPFYPFSFWVPLLKPNSRKKGTLIIKGLLGNLGYSGR